MTMYRCDKCGVIDEQDVHEICEKHYEPYGDSYAERVEIFLECGICGGEDIEEFNPLYCSTCDD